MTSGPRRHPSGGAAGIPIGLSNAGRCVRRLGTKEVQMLDEMFPILTSPDLPGALAFYRDLLGGRVAYQFPPDGEPGYVGLTLGGGQLGIGQATPAPHGLDPASGGSAPAGRISLWAYVQDCDAAVERLRAAGVRVTEEPADQPWGERVARVLDPDGNEVVLGQRPPG